MDSFVTPAIRNRFDHSWLGEPNSGCWLWVASLTADGYGQMSVGPRHSCKVYSAHRISYEIHIGPIPEDMFVCHKCDTPGCVNPHHFFLGDGADNTFDMVDKTRHARHEKHGAAKLTEDQVARILAMSGKQRDIARMFGVSQKAVFNIKHGKSWCDGRTPRSPAITFVKPRAGQAGAPED